MARAELLGGHSHPTSAGVNVHIWMRSGKYLARGSFEGARFGETLGSDSAEATISLRQLLTALDNGTYRPPSVRRQSFIQTGEPPKLSVRELVEKLLTERRSTRGRKTAEDYRGRLAHLVAFSEMPESRRRWPIAAQCDRQFAVDLRAYLFGMTTTGNGHT